jgi:hypothetical protein
LRHDFNRLGALKVISFSQVKAQIIEPGLSGFGWVIYFSRLFGFFAVLANSLIQIIELMLRTKLLRVCGK